MNKNRQKWKEMYRNGQKWTEMYRNGQKLIEKNNSIANKESHKF